MGEGRDVSQEAVRDLTALLRGDGGAQPAEITERPDVAAARAQFCQQWPAVRPVLTALRDLLKSRPGIGGFSGPAIGMVLAAGDAAHAAFCGQG